MKKTCSIVFSASVARLTVVLAACMGLLCAGVAMAAPAQSTSVIILPFQINAPANQQSLAVDIPDLFAKSLTEQGFKAISPKKTRQLAQRRKLTTFDAASAQKLAAASGASYAVFGSLNVIGDAFTLDARIVPATGATKTSPYTADRKTLVELLPAVQDVAAQMGQLAAASGATPTFAKAGGLGHIDIRGLKVLDPDVVLMRLSINKGDTVNDAVINDEIKRIWEIGYFTDVSANVERSAEGPVLVFTVVEKPRIQDVVINGSEAVSKSDILAAMSSKTGSVINERLLAQDIQKITDLYRKQGYYLADVKSRIEAGATGVAVLIFDVTEGNKLYIKNVVLNGLETMSESDVREQMALKERGLISFITGTGVLREDYLERDSAAITAHGLNNGYVNIQVSAPDVQYEDDGIIVTYTIQEGFRAKLGEITFSGDLIDTPERLMEVIQLDEQKQNNTYFSMSVMQDDIKRLTDFYSNYGYAFAEVDVRNSGDEAEQIINIDYAINKKQKVYVRRVTTEGNTRTRDNVILREMRIGDGDVFDGEKLRRTSERLHRLRYFSEVDTEIRPTNNESEVDLNVKVADDRTGAIMGGVGYSTFSKVGFSASIEERNLFGKGYSLGLQGFFSSRTNLLQLNFINPRLYDSDLGFGNETYITRYQWTDFTKKTIGNTMRLFYPIGEYTTITGSYRLDRYELYDFDDDAPRSYQDYRGNNMTSALGASIVYDSTDSRTQPTKGWIVRLGGEYGGGGLGGNDNFFKPTADAQTFFMLDNRKNHVVHLRSRIGAVFENSNKPVPVFDRFFIGGIDSVRGYDIDDMSPRDKKYGDEIGGDRMGFANIEYIWTVEPKLGVALVPFFDIGFENDSKQHSDFDNLKKSVGLELRWRSPMGDLRFAYGYPLDKSSTGEKLNGRFEFSMGQNF